MNLIIGLLIIAIGAFCQSSSYVPINKIKEWSWESYWIVQGVFAWLVFPLIGALLAVPSGHSLGELFSNAPSFNLWMTIFFGVLWGIGGLTFGLSMRYLGVALGQSIALGTCSGLGTIMGPVLLNIFFPELNALQSLTWAVIIGVVVMLLGIAIIGVAGGMKAASLPEEEKKKAVKDFNFSKGLAIALLAGFMSGCFNVGLEFGKEINFPETQDIFKTLPATLLVTIGGFVTNAVYCFWQNTKNKTWGDYKKGNVWGNNLIFCALAGLLWYSQFFGLSLGKGFFTEYPTMMTLAFCILMALNVTFSNVWGIILKEWKGCSKKTITVLVIGLVVLVFSTFLPQLLA
ncbi:MAG: rhamnose/proton symporter RhaT [Bacteroidales bacterium]|nr:rhamnose/proton symporter RhaT [Bacteroidales bacterium]MBQ9173056.1 rhamnose/proton symporter RhaT [Bacteroidales bacterium]MBQ9713495.1 rhamnose/proton symporter RhaT [Bacteroidales bacterium]MBR6416132.1 rhamnose/proton symporter RhaT [Bacteroidales bacterium]